MALRYAYKQPDGTIALVYAAPKENLERVLGPLTDAQYEAHVVERSIPADAANVTKLPADWEPPADRETRNAELKRFMP